MQRDIPTPLVIVVLLLVVAIAGFLYYRSNRTSQGAGVTEDEMRREFLQRARNGQLPGVSPEQMKRLEQRVQQTK